MLVKPCTPLSGERVTEGVNEIAWKANKDATSKKKQTNHESVIHLFSFLLDFTGASESQNGPNTTNYESLAFRL
jgi:hypothetical protein